MSESLYTELPASAQTAYAQLLDAALAAQHLRTVADLTGSFATKTVKGRPYWYFQYTEPAGKLHQLYVGPDNEAVRRLVETKRQPAASERLQPLARSAIVLGCRPVVVRQFRVIRRLAEYGFFRAGVVVGTHAYLALGNMLGVRWSGEELTQDIDFAHAGKALAVALPTDIEVRTDDAIASLEMGFLPIGGLSGKLGGSYLIPTEPEFRLDFLTPRHRNGDEPFLHPLLHVTLQPLPFIEYALEDVEQAAVLSPEGAIIVNVPHPARFALHKLLVHGERRGAFATKGTKDLAQAAALLQYLVAHGPDSLEHARRDLLARGRGWIGRYREGVKALAARYPRHGALAMLRKA